MVKAAMPELTATPIDTKKYVVSLRDVEWLMATVGECFDQELGDIELIEQGIKLYGTWFADDHFSSIIKHKRNLFVVEMVAHLCKVLRPILSSSITSKQHLEAAVHATELMLTTMRQNTIQESAWDSILDELLKVALEVTDRDLRAPVGDPNIPALGAEDTYPSEIAPHLISLVLEAMVRSGTRDMQKWHKFVTKYVRKLQKRPNAIGRICVAMESVTAAIVSAHYPIDPNKFTSLFNGKASDMLVDTHLAIIVSNTASAMQGSDAAGEEKDKRLVKVFLNALDARTLVAMRLDQLHDLWRMLMSLPGDVSCVSHPTSFNSLARTAQRIATLLLRVRNVLQSHGSLEMAVPDSVSVFDIVGPFLFRCSDRLRHEPPTAEGVASAYAGLCDLFYTQRSRDRPMPQQMRLAFFHALHRALSQFSKEMRSVVQTIIIHSSPLFSLGFEGVSFLIPTLVSQLDAVLMLPDNQFPSPAHALLVRTKAVTLLGSFVGLPQSCAGLELPFDQLSRDSPIWTMMRETELSASVMRSSLRASTDLDDVKRTAEKARSNRFGVFRSTLNKSGDKVPEPSPNTPPPESTVISNSIDCVSWIGCNILKKALVFHSTTECQQHMILMLAVLALEDVERDSSLAIHTLRFLASYMTDNSSVVDIATHIKTIESMAVILEIDDIQYANFDIAYEIASSLANFLGRIFEISCPYIAARPNQWVDLVCAALACIADAMSLPHAGPPGPIVEVVLRGINYSHDQLVPSMVSEVRSAARLCLSFIINPLPPCEPWVCRQVQDPSVPVLFAGCVKSNAILALSETSDGVRLTLRSEIGEFAFLAQAVWETQADAELRLKSERNVFNDKGAWTPPLLEQPPSDQVTVALQDAIRARFSDEFKSLFTESGKLTEYRDQIARDTKQSHREGQDLSHLEPARPVGPNTHAQDPSGNHLSRLFLSTVGGLSPVIESEPTVTLLTNNERFQTALRDLDATAPFRRKIAVGIQTDGELDKDFLDFFLSLGKRDMSLPDSEDVTRVWVTRRHSIVFSNRSMSGSAIDNVTVQWCSRRPTDDLVEAYPSHIFVHQIQSRMFLLRTFAERCWPIKDLMIVSHISLAPLLRWASISQACDSASLFRDNLHQLRAARIEQIISEFKSEQDFAILVTTQKSE
eukprot:c18317_g1_i2.p1 GENE.c18317_g1_i2~~c18317_g1_i2.p1  ORF type:complete len:1183 (-),score=277.74 c18317_g1_i2:91-3537(-)